MPGLIPDHVLDQVRQSNDIVEVIGAYFPLKRAGANFRALCPFHKEKTPSFNVHPAKQIWHCFGCGAGGDVFGFVMKYENLDFISAVRRLAERAGITLEYEERDTGPSRDQKQLLLNLHEAAAAFFHQTLLKDPSAQIARDYVARRRLSAETVRAWRIGYSPDAWDALIKWAAAKRYPITLLELAGLVVPREGGGYYDRFRGRLMFPICDEQGQVIAFSGRILTDDKQQAKYVNSPETPNFQKGRVLFALDKAKRAILDEKLAIVCEGQVDTIACHEAGLTHVVAPQGTALTEQHARVLKRHTDAVVLMFDGDEAGQNAAVRNAEPLWDMGLEIRVALLPEGHDPDSFLKKHGRDALLTILADAPGFLDFLLGRLARQHDPGSERGKQQIAQNMVGWLCRIRDPILQAAYAQKTAARLELPEDILRRAMKQHVDRHRRGESTAEAESEPAPATAPTAEDTLLQLMLADDRLIDAVRAQLDLSWLTGAVAGELIRRVLDSFSRGEWAGANSLLNELGDEDASRLVSRLLMQKLPAEDRRAAAVTECLGALQRRWVEREWQRVQRRLRQPGLPPGEVTVLQQQVLDLRRKLDHIPPLSVRQHATGQ